MRLSINLSIMITVAQQRKKKVLYEAGKGKNTINFFKTFLFALLGRLEVIPRS